MREIALSIIQPSGTPLAIETPKGIQVFTLPALLKWGIGLTLTASILLTLFYLVSGGIDMITSGGDKQKVVNSRQKLTYAIIGLIIVLSSFFIIRTVEGIFGIDLFAAFAPDCSGTGSC